MTECPRIYPGQEHYEDVTIHCQPCDICQRTAPRSKCGKTPFVIMPIIGAPFDPGKTNMVICNNELTNASDSGLGAVLLQEYDEVNMSVMSISRKLNGSETGYSRIERECFIALFGATKRLLVYVYGLTVYSHN